MFALPFFAISVLAAAVFSDSRHRTDSYGYGEGSLARIPSHTWNRGTWGLRGPTMSWRRPLPSEQDQFEGIMQAHRGAEIGVRGPTTSWRHPLPRPWEEPPESIDPKGIYEEEIYGVSTGAAGIRGVHLPAAFTPEQIRAYNIDGAAQGLQGGSLAPPG